MLAAGVIYISYNYMYKYTHRQIHTQHTWAELLPELKNLQGFLSKFLFKLNSSTMFQSKMLNVKIRNYMMLFSCFPENWQLIPFIAKNTNTGPHSRTTLRTDLFLNRAYEWFKRTCRIHQFFRILSFLSGTNRIYKWSDLS